MAIWVSKEPYRSDELIYGAVNHYVTVAEDCDPFDHMKQICTTTSNNKSVTCETLCIILLY